MLNFKETKMRTAELEGVLAATRVLRVAERIRAGMALDEIEVQLDRLDPVLSDNALPLDFNLVAGVHRNIQNSVSYLRGFLSTTSRSAD